MGKFIDLTGKQFGRLTVIERAGNNKWGSSMWLCECSCENKTRKIISSRNLITKNTVGCGCIQKENVTERIKKISITHNMSKTNEYTIWVDIKKRCYNENNVGFHLYGGRGIKMSKEWYFSFEQFYKDMGDRPGPEYSIDRINNDGDYCKENCRWTTDDIQKRNTRRNVFVEYNGEKRILKDWAEILEIPYTVLYSRVRIRNWDINKAFTQPVKTLRN